MITVSSCNHISAGGEDQETDAAAGAPKSCDTAALKINNGQWYTDTAGRMWVFGELSNTSGTDRLLPQICISIRTASSERIERRYAGPILLRAGEAVAFSAIVESAPVHEDFSLSFAATSLPIDRNQDLIAIVYRDFNVSASIRLSPGDKDADIHGILTNTGGLPASNIFVAVGLYDKQGTLVGVAKGKVSSLDILEPGATLTFTLVSSQLSENTTNLSTRIFVEGQTIEGSN
ncbi:MAG: FxLYD domain-containing protein [Candidatus Roseilinea sp.]|uniref:FxLYD domain-containing protein n=1 Tax=Candidatus Roseilinea sp. TaxID=2838777 RepID=UPI00404B182A